MGWQAWEPLGACFHCHCWLSPQCRRRAQVLNCFPFRLFLQMISHPTIWHQTLYGQSITGVVKMKLPNIYGKFAQFVIRIKKYATVMSWPLLSLTRSYWKVISKFTAPSMFCEMLLLQSRNLFPQSIKAPSQSRAQMFDPSTQYTFQIRENIWYR